MPSGDASALLVLHSPGIGEEINSKGHIKDYMCKNFDHWIEFATDRDPTSKLDDGEITFASGTVKATRWEIAVSQDYPSASASDRWEPQVSDRPSTALQASIADPQQSNQCIFMHLHSLLQDDATAENIGTAQHRSSQAFLRERQQKLRCVQDCNDARYRL